MANMSGHTIGVQQSTKFMTWPGADHLKFGGLSPNTAAVLLIITDKANIYKFLVKYYCSHLKYLDKNTLINSADT